MNLKTWLILIFTVWTFLCLLGAAITIAVVA